jgi:hypothetical protein
MADASIRIRATDETQAAFAAVARSMRGLETSATGIRTAFAAVLGGTAATFLYKAVAAFIDAEQASARLGATLKATGNAVGFTKEQLDALADSLAATTQFDDESIRNASASLIKFGNISGEAFNRALRAAMDWAAFTGEALPDAAQTIGAALSASEGGLGRLERQLGKLTYEEERFIKSLEDSGDAMGAQAEKLRIIEARIGGVADEMNTGLGAATADAEKAWDEFLEGFGRTADEAGRFERAARGAATVLRDITSLSQGAHTPLHTLAQDIASIDLALLRALPGFGVLAKLLEAGQIPARIGAAGKQIAQGKITGLGADEAEARAKASSAAQRAAAFWDAELQKGDKISARLEKEAEERRKKAIADAQRAADKFAEIQARAAPPPIDADFEALEKFWAGVALNAKAAVDEIERATAAERAFLELQAKAAPPPMDVEFEDLEKFWAETAAGVRKVREEADPLRDIARDLGLTFSSAFEDAIVLGKSLQDVLKGIGQDIIRIIARETVTKPIAGAVMSVIGPLLKGIFPGGGGGKAAGGPVSGGQPYLVGERGPELFVPGTSGTVVPNHAIGGNVTVNVAVDARGQTGSGDPAQAGRTIGALVADAVRREIINQQRSGGLLAT